jgi:hypothetical protein
VLSLLLLEPAEPLTPPPIPNLLPPQAYPGKFDVIIGDLADPLEGGPCYQLYTQVGGEGARGRGGEGARGRGGRGGGGQEWR